MLLIVLKTLQDFYVIKRHQCVHSILNRFNLFLSLAIAVPHMLVHALQRRGHPPQTLNDVLIISFLINHVRVMQIL